MGIVNLTPDSFSDGGRYLDVRAAVAHSEALIDEGADLLDLGAESSRPGALPVGLDEELDRLLPVLEALKASPVPLSVDTVKPEVMRAALGAGASMINDITGVQNDEALAAVAASNCAVCVMHMQGEPRSMQRDPHYVDVVGEVRAFLQAQIGRLQAAGVGLDRIVVDPGFGFGKTALQNFEMLRSFSTFCTLGPPVLAGLSRKSMLNVTGDRTPDQRLGASIAAALAAVSKGALLLRVHDVRATQDALRIWEIVENRRSPHTSAPSPKVSRRE